MSKVQQWVALVRSDRLGVDVPIVTSTGNPKVWIARDRESALVQVQADIRPETFAACEVLSLSEVATLCD